MAVPILVKKQVPSCFCKKMLVALNATTYTRDWYRHLVDDGALLEGFLRRMKIFLYNMAFKNFNYHLFSVIFSWVQTSVGFEPSISGSVLYQLCHCPCLNFI